MELFDKNLGNLKPHDELRLWSVRNADELKLLSEGHVLRTDTDLVDAYFVKAYDWISDYFAQHTPRPKGVKYPVWAWYQFRGEHAKRPDLRCRWGERGQEMALVEFCLPSELVLLSYYQAWHFPLNGWPLPTSEDDEMRFQQLEEELSPETYQEAVQKSWNKIFMPEDLDPAYHSKPEDRQIQAIVWEIPAYSVVNIQRFCSK